MRKSDVTCLGFCAWLTGGWLPRKPQIVRLQTCISPAHLRCLRIWNNAGMVASKLDAHCTFPACPTLGSQHASDVPNTPYRQRIVACLLVVVLSMLVFQCDSSRHHQASVLFQRNSSTGLKRILCHLSRTRNTATSNRRATVFLTDVRYMITIRVTTCCWVKLWSFDGKLCFRISSVRT